MNISDESLLNLKCSECDNFLSRIPIYLKEDGSAICGRCPIPLSDAESEEPIKVIRMKPFETIIKYIKFPCIYKNNGCPEEIITLNLENHEESCKYRPYMCIISPGTCDWIGWQDNFYEHCQLKHSAQIIQHPCNFKYDITNNSTGTHITRAFNMLFLVHTKVCLSTHKIYHSVHYLENVPNMYFKLVIRRRDEKIVKMGKIEPVGCRTIKENLSVSCGINSIIDIFGDFDETNFTIKIICKASCKICNSFSDQLIEDDYCKKCNEKRTECIYSNKGCTYKDINIKTSIHERCLCKFTTWCWICERHLSDSTILSQHYERIHDDCMFIEQVYWDITDGMFSNNQFDFIIVSKYDRFYCTLYTLQQTCLIEVCSATLNTVKLSQLKFVVSIKNNEKIEKVHLSFYTNNKIDWYDHFPRSYLFANDSSYKIKFDILKADEEC